MRRGVIRTEGAPISREQAWLAAVLAARCDVVLSHGTAAAAWGLKGYEDPDAIDLLTTGRRPALPGVRGHRTLLLPDAHRTVLHGIPITTPERTLVDACGLVSQWALERACDDALRRGLVHLPKLVRCAKEVPASGRRKIAPVNRLLAERVPGYDPGGSDAELDVMKILTRAGIRPLPVQQYRVRVDGRTYKLDYAWPDTLHAVEYLGNVHASMSALHYDSKRVVGLQRTAWTIWPVTSRTSASEVVAVGLTATGALSHGSEPAA